MGVNGLIMGSKLGTFFVVAGYLTGIVFHSLKVQIRVNE